MWNLKSASSVIIRDSDKKIVNPPAALMENYETDFVRSAYKMTGLMIWGITLQKDQRYWRDEFTYQWSVFNPGSSVLWEFHIGLRLINFGVPPKVLLKNKIVRCVKFQKIGSAPYPCAILWRKLNEKANMCLSLLIFFVFLFHFLMLLDTAFGLPKP